MLYAAAKRDRERCAKKINRDMVIRAVLKVAEEIDFSKAKGKVFSEGELEEFVAKALSVRKRVQLEGE